MAPSCHLITIWAVEEEHLQGIASRVMSHLLFVCLFNFGFSRQGLSIALEPVLKLAFLAQAGLELTEIRLPLFPECWD